MSTAHTRANIVVLGYVLSINIPAYTAPSFGWVVACGQGMCPLWNESSQQYVHWKVLIIDRNHRVLA